MILDGSGEFWLGLDGSGWFWWVLVGSGRFLWHLDLRCDLSEACVFPGKGFGPGSLPGVPPNQTPKIAQNGSLEGCFATILGSSWGPPQPALENCLEWLPGSFFRYHFKFFLGTILGSSWGPPQAALENGSEWLPESVFRDCFGLCLGLAAI